MFISQSVRVAKQKIQPTLSVVNTAAIVHLPSGCDGVYPSNIETRSVNDKFYVHTKLEERVSKRETKVKWWLHRMKKIKSKDVLKHFI